MRDFYDSIVISLHQICGFEKDLTRFYFINMVDSNIMGMRWNEHWTRDFNIKTQGTNENDIQRLQRLDLRENRTP